MLSIVVNAQVNFKRDYMDMNPAKGVENLTSEAEILLHESFLQDAQIANDTLSQLYGLFYLFADYYQLNDYVELKQIVLHAEKLVHPKSPPEWQGALRMRTAYMLEIVDKDLDGAISEFKEGLELCKNAKDTLCIAESLEQISNINKNLKNYGMAEDYFKQAIPLLRSNAPSSSLSLAYSNYSLLEADQGKYDEALLYIDSALSISTESRDSFGQALYISNKASIYYRQQRYDDAIQLYKKVLPINAANDWSDNLLYNYAGLINSYEETGQYEKSNVYLQKYYELKDSLTGASVQEKIDRLELNSELSKKTTEIAIQDKKLLQSASIRERLIAAILILTLCSILLYFLYSNNRRIARREKKSNREYIDNLRIVLKAKNAEIATIAKAKNIAASGRINILNDPSNSEETADLDHDFKIFDTRIISDQGVTAFKSYFDKVYPGFLIKVRNRWPAISDAEERLFMLIKLNIKSKEAAEILGISPSSVKKSRNRLRKRLDIEPSTNLEQFVKDFR